MTPSFKHFDLTLPNPRYESPLVDLTTELERLRALRLQGSTPAPVFFQLKSIFHLLESFGSARIEGNHTTLADYVESKVEGKQDSSDQLREIANIEDAMSYIEEQVKPGEKITEHLIRELHQMTVRNLEREGDRTPGAYRSGSVRINQSNHLPPDAVQVPAYMQQLVAFINANDPSKYELIKVAQAHHRFGWIHPFSNGNGRVVRLLTYTMLIKYGFNVKAGGRVLNPTAVFCNDRDRYYAMLGKADSGTDEGQEQWCIYVLSGIRDELKKIEKLTRYDDLKDKILTPALNNAEQRKWITPQEKAILVEAIKSETGIVKAADLEKAMTGLTAPQRTYQIKKLLERKMLQPVKEGGRQYTISFNNNYLIRGIIDALREEGFIPPSLQN